MESWRKNIPLWLIIVLLIFLGLIFAAWLWQVSSTTNLGNGDFVGYWSATYLLHNGLNPYDPQLMENLQHTQMQTGLTSTIMAWNPPVLFVVLLPLAWLPFAIAKFVWLMVNITIILAASLMLARLYLPENNYKVLLFFLLFAVSLPQVISGIFIGQVTFLVFFGLVVCLMLIKKGQWFWAGAVLILTTIKPHLVILSVIYLLLYMAQRRQYLGWVGLIVAGTACALVLFIFRSSWIQDLMGELKISPVHWLTPTIGGLFSYFGVSDIARYLIVLLLPLPFILLRYQAAIKLELAVALLTLITVPTTFFGWSYDQTILLIPIAQVFGWLNLSKDKASNAWFVFAIALGLAGIFFQHFFTRNDVFYLCLVPVILVVHIWFEMASCFKNSIRGNLS